MPRVSILTPIYNVERYLGQCLQSLLDQTMDDLEFICVNDGSTDSSLRILEEFAARDSRIVIIDKANSGYGDSMNCGLRAARGEYVGIVESDDFVAPECFARLYHLAAEHDFPDVVKANYYTYNEKNGEVFIRNFPQSICGRVIDPLTDDMSNAIVSVPAIWSAIYRRDFLQENGIEFLPTPGASFQDTGFVFKSFIAARSILFEYDGYLRYRIDNSNSSVKSPLKVYCVCDELESIMQFLDERPQQKAVLQNFVSKIMFHTYEWNLDRLAVEHRRSFASRMYKELSEQMAAGHLDRQVFTKGEWYRLSNLLNNPLGYANAHVGQDKASDNPKVSVVVDMQDIANADWDALDSILHQTLFDIEVICVDCQLLERTTKERKAFTKLRKFAKHDQRLRIARNVICDSAFARVRGIMESRGKYVYFHDGKTFMEPDMLSRMIDQAERTGADFVVDSANRNRVPHQRPFVISDIDSDAFGAFRGSLADKLVSRELLERAGLCELDQRNDTEPLFVFSALLNANAIAIATDSDDDAHLPVCSPTLEELGMMREQLRERKLFDRFEKDFVNHSLREVMRCLDGADVQSFTMLRKELQGGWAAKLGIEGRRTEYYYDPLLYDRFARLISKRGIALCTELTRRAGMQGIRSIKARITEVESTQ